MLGIQATTFYPLFHLELNEKEELLTHKSFDVSLHRHLCYDKNYFLFSSGKQQNYYLNTLIFFCEVSKEECIDCLFSLRCRLHRGSYENLYGGT